MIIEVILFDWGGTLSQVVCQDQRLREGARAAGRIIAGADGDGLVEPLIERVLAAEAEAAADREHREADLVARLHTWAASVRAQASAADVAAAADAFCQCWVGSLEPLPGAVEAIQRLRARGFRMGLVSNCMLPPAYSRQEFDRHGFAGLLDFTLFSSELGYRKPAPVVYAEALRRAFAGQPPADLSRVLFVGDSPTLDVIAPASLGMQTALVTCRRGIWPKADYARARPDLRIDSVAELPDLLERA